jgi:S-adenosylmethionine:tRNA ribosyltransferase-isomerase
MTFKRKFTLQDFDFNLPDDLIAQYPCEKRDDSRLLVAESTSGRIEHAKFNQIGKYLLPGDVLLVNDARVISARMFFRRETGGAVEVILARKYDKLRWRVITDRTGRLRIGETLISAEDDSIKIKIIRRIEDSFDIETSVEFDEKLIGEIGIIPLPPYINRKADDIDVLRYQTVYADKNGAAAAPTAGLHFTDELINGLKNMGIIFAPLTLYVSWGTFKPVRDNDLSLHKMHTEAYDLPDKTADIINNARKQKRRIIAVGTTALRVLESTYFEGANRPGTGETDIFIYPPYDIKSADCLITNFHTPKSTLLMLVSAFGGYDQMMQIYYTAIAQKYRFFSYGDAMMIIRKSEI